MASLFHLHIGLSRALINKRDQESGKGKMRTQGLGQEIVYHLAPSHSTASSFEAFGIKNVKRAFFVVCVNLTDDLIKHIKETLSGVRIEGQPAYEELNVEAHSSYHDSAAIRNMFEISAESFQSSDPNCYLN